MINTSVTKDRSKCSENQSINEDWFFYHINNDYLSPSFPFCKQNIKVEPIFFLIFQRLFRHNKTTSNFFLTNFAIQIILWMTFIYKNELHIRSNEVTGTCFKKGNNTFILIFQFRYAFYNTLPYIKNVLYRF